MTSTPRALVAASGDTPSADARSVMPGQALAYLTGKLEILRLRDDARARLGDAFALPAFHAAVLDSGSLPMPVLERRLDRWVQQRLVDH